MADPSNPSTPAAEAWTTRRLLAWMSDAFTKAGLESPRLQSEMLLAHVVGCPRLRLFTEPERTATEAERGRLRALVARALKHEPIDYLVGERSFFGLLFQVDRRVLVPRPSTETIVEHVLQAARQAERSLQDSAGNAPSARPSAGTPAREYVPAPTERVFDLEHRTPSETLSAFKPDESDLEEEDESALDKPAVPMRRAPAPPPPAATPTRGTPLVLRPRATGPAWRIADICTGSGCIAIALAKQLPGAALFASDISPDALAVAATNAKRHGVADRVMLLTGDLASPLAPHAPFDVIVSNPPYIPDDEWADVPPNVKDHEPHLALRAGTDGLDLIRPLLASAPALLAPGGLLLIELAASRSDRVLALARATPSLTGATILRDCDNLPRVLLATRA